MTPGTIRSEELRKRRADAVHVTGVVPTANAEPDSGLQLTSGTCPELSTAVGVGKVTIAVPLGPALAVISACADVKIGAVSSSTCSG